MTKSKAVCVLVVDDHVDTVCMIDRLLTAAGYSVLTATTATQAVGLLRSIKCDVLLTDIGLPDGTGLELMRQMREQYGLTGIAMSGYNSDEHRDAARHAGFHQFLSKPVDFKLLLSHVRELTS